MTYKHIVSRINKIKQFYPFFKDKSIKLFDTTYEFGFIILHDNSIYIPNKILHNLMFANYFRMNLSNDFIIDHFNSLNVEEDWLIEYYDYIAFKCDYYDDTLDFIINNNKNIIKNDDILQIKLNNITSFDIFDIKRIAKYIIAQTDKNRKLSIFNNISISKEIKKLQKFFKKDIILNKNISELYYAPSLQLSNYIIKNNKIIETSFYINIFSAPPFTLYIRDNKNLYSFSDKVYEDFVSPILLLEDKYLQNFNISHLNIKNSIDILFHTL